MLRGRRYSPRTCATSPIDEQPSRSYEPPIAGSNRSRQSRRRFGTWPPWWPRARSRARCSTPSANRQGCCSEPPASTWPTSRRMPTASRWQGGACTMHTYPRAPGCRLMVKPSTIVRRTGRPARIETYEGVGGELAARLRSLGIRCDVGAPVFVDGEVWGALMAGSDGSVQFPADAEARLADVTNLIATAISNAESQSALASSRMRIVTAADQTRRRIERNLHDGTQQHLVSLALELRAAQSLVPRELHELRAELTRIGDAMGAIQEELREIARGIHPAILAEGGLAPALRTLARRSACPVKLDVPIEERLPEPVEVAIYYIVSEALTNTAKHAHASVVEVEVEAVEGVVSASVRDDGDGGADPDRGSGLIGLTDRVEALGGSLAVQSPTGGGTHLHVEIPLDVTRI